MNKKPREPTNTLEVTHDLESCQLQFIEAETEQEAGGAETEQAGGSDIEQTLEEEQAQESILATTEEIEYSDEYLYEYDQPVEREDQLVEREVDEQVICAASEPQNVTTSNPKKLSVSLNVSKGMIWVNGLFSIDI